MLTVKEDTALLRSHIFTSPPTRSARAWRTLLVAALILPTTLSACSSEEDQIAALEHGGPGYAAEFERMRERTKGSRDEAITLKIYEDNFVSDEELVESGARMVKCVQDAGFPEWNLDPFGDYNGTLLRLTEEESKRFNQVHEDCSMEITQFGWVHSMWSSQRLNPSNTNMSDIYAACMVKLKAVDTSFNGKDIDKAFEEFGKRADAKGAVHEGEPSDVFPLIVDQEAGREAFHRCITEPHKVLGFATPTAP